MPTLFFLSAPPGARTAAAAEFTPKALAQWLHNAPTANQALFSRELYERIGAINRAGLGGQALFELAELLRPALLSVQSYLLAKVADENAYPLRSEAQAAAELLLNLGREFGQMYSVLLQEFDAALEGTERDLGLLLHRLVRCVSSLLLAYYSVHLKVPAWLWRDLHALYRLAVQKRKADERQRDEAAIHQAAPSLEDIYVQILLLGLADPYGLQAQEILAVYHQLEHWAPMVRPRQTGGLLPRGGWVVQLDQDRPPIWMAKETTGLLLDLSPLDKHLAELVGRINVRAGRFEPRIPSAAPGGLGHDLLCRLRRCWRNEAAGASESVLVEGGVSVLPGFRATHMALNPATAAEAPLPPSWDATLLAEGLLCCEGGVPGRVALGALVSYVPLLGAGSRGLAVVDRVLMDRLGGVVKFSLRKLTDRVMAAGLQPAKPNPKNPASYQRALVYVDEQAKPVRSFVVLESLRMQEGNLVRLLTDRGMTFVKLAGRENIALGCARLECVAAVT